MTVAVVVPFNPGDPYRDRNWAWLRRRWRLLHAWPITEGHSPPPWSKGEALARAVADVDADLLVVADADVFCDPVLIDACIAAVQDGAAWAMPHGHVCRLTARSTDALLRQPPEGPPPRWLVGRRHVAPAGGGIVVVSRQAWDRSGGIDPRFIGWGGDDISWARALDTLAGPGVHQDGTLWHLWHPRQERRPGGRGSAENEALAGRYLDAAGDPDAMRDLVAREPAWPSP